jgi:hypothetical protein
MEFTLPLPFLLPLQSVEPEEVMVFLNTLFSAFDRLIDEFGVHKVRTRVWCSAHILNSG